MKAVDEDILIAFSEGGRKEVMQILGKRYEEHVEDLAETEAEDGEHGIRIARRCMEIKERYTLADYLNEHEKDNLKLLNELEQW